MTIIVRGKKAVVRRADILIQMGNEGLMVGRRIQSKGRGSGEILEAQGDTDPLCLGLNAFEYPCLGAGSQQEAAIQNAKAGHTPLGKFVVGYGVHINSIKGFFLGTLEQIVSDPLHASLTAVFLIYENKGEFCYPCLRTGIKQGGVSHKNIIFRHGDSGNQFICLVEFNNPFRIIDVIVKKSITM